MELEGVHDSSELKVLGPVQSPLSELHVSGCECLQAVFIWVPKVEIKVLRETALFVVLLETLVEQGGRPDW